MNLKFLKILFILSLIVMPTFFSHPAMAGQVASEPIKILLVPGHDNEVWGAQIGKVKEADMNLALALRLQTILKKDKRFKVYMTRDKQGYTKEFENYFANEKDDIITFRENAKEQMKEKVATGDFIEKEGVPHNNASADMSVILYGINKWASDNKMDAVIHIHFNDYPRENAWTKGKHKGFAVYAPEDQMANSVKSTALAQSIFKELKKKYITSTYEEEAGGFLKEQGLIALGANGTLPSDVRSLLIEYGYIYRFSNYAFRQKFYKNASTLTAVGIKNYFFPKP